MVTRVFVEKKQGFNIEAQQMLADLKGNLGLRGLEEVRILNRYDVSGLSEEQFGAAARTILSEPTMDAVYGEDFRLPGEYQVFAMEYLPGQYDQRADSAAQCVQLLTQGERPAVATAKVIGLKGQVSAEEFEKVKHYLINPVESREASMEKPATLEMQADVPRRGPCHRLYHLGQGPDAGVLRLHGLCHDPLRPGVLPGLLPGRGAPGPHCHRAAGH